MESGHCKLPKIMNDRLSMLPIDLIHKILSFTSIKSAIQTSALSSRWRSIWTSMPYLNLSTRHVPRFSEFTNHVFAARNDQIDLYSVDLCFVPWTFSHAMLKRVLEYAFSHNVQQLTVTCVFGDKTDFPLSQLFRSQSLRSLSLTGSDTGFLDAYSIDLASALKLPALTTLHLDYVTFDEGNDAGPFSKCVNLKNLTLSHFMVLNSRSLTLCHPRISNLTLENGHWTLDAVNVVAPQLESLTISYCHGKYQITASNLASLLFHGPCLLKFSTELPSLEKVGLSICSPDIWRPYRIARLLHQLSNVKLLTLNLEFLEPLISCMERISPQPSPFCNLKSLKVYPDYVPLDDETHERVNLSTKVINYLLDGSPSATFTLISYEEIKEKKQKARALANAAAAQKLMVDLQVMLEREKGNIVTCRDQPVEADAHDQGKSPVEKVQLHFERKMEQMKSYWDDVGKQIDRGRERTCYIISRLRDIEEVLLLKDMPTSKRDELLACFSVLCSEVDTVVKKILHHTKIPQIRFDDCFNDLATTSISSS